MIRSAVLVVAVLASACVEGDPVSTPSGAAVLRYETTYRYSSDQPEDATECGSGVFFGNTSGVFEVVARGADTAILHWEGLGCDVAVRGPHDGPWSATDLPCEPRPDSGMEHFGVTRLHLDEFGYEPSTETLTARGRMSRPSGGAQSSFCFDVPQP